MSPNEPDFFPLFEFLRKENRDSFSHVGIPADAMSQGCVGLAGEEVTMNFVERLSRGHRSCRKLCLTYQYKCFWETWWKQSLILIATVHWQQNRSTFAAILSFCVKYYSKWIWNWFHIWLFQSLKELFWFFYSLQRLVLRNVVRMHAFLSESVKGSQTRIDRRATFQIKNVPRAEVNRRKSIRGEQTTKSSGNKLNLFKIYNIVNFWFVRGPSKCIWRAKCDPRGCVLETLCLIKWNWLHVEY